jgi:hypothetical protein
MAHVPFLSFIMSSFLRSLVAPAVVYDWARQCHTINGDPVYGQLPEWSRVILSEGISVNPYEVTLIKQEDIGVRDTPWQMHFIGGNGDPNATVATFEDVYVLSRSFYRDEIVILDRLSKHYYNRGLRFLSKKQDAIGSERFYLVHRLGSPAWSGKQDMSVQKKAQEEERKQNPRNTPLEELEDHYSDLSWSVYYSYGVLNRADVSPMLQGWTGSIFIQVQKINVYTKKKEQSLIVHINRGPETIWIIPPLNRIGFRHYVPEYRCEVTQIVDWTVKIHSSSYPQDQLTYLTIGNNIVPIEFIFLSQGPVSQEGIYIGECYAETYEYARVPAADPPFYQSLIDEYQKREEDDPKTENDKRRKIGWITTQLKEINREWAQTRQNPVHRQLQNLPIGYGVLQSMIDQITAPEPLFFLDRTIRFESIDVDYHEKVYKDQSRITSNWLHEPYKYSITGRWKNIRTQEVIALKSVKAVRSRNQLMIKFREDPDEWRVECSITWANSPNIQEWVHERVYGPHGGLVQAEYDFQYPGGQEEEEQELKERGHMTLEAKKTYRERRFVAYYESWKQRAEHNLVSAFIDRETKLQHDLVYRVQEKQRYNNRDTSTIEPIETEMDTTGVGVGKRGRVEEDQPLPPRANRDFIPITSDMLTYEWIDRYAITPEEWKEEVERYIVEYQQGAYGKDLPEDAVSDGAREDDIDMIVKQYTWKTRHKKTRVLYGSSVLGFNPSLAACGIYVLMTQKGGGKHLLNEIAQHMRDKYPWVYQLILQSVEVPATKQFYKKYGFVTQLPDQPDSIYMKYVLKPTKDLETTGAGTQWTKKHHRLLDKIANSVDIRPMYSESDYLRLPKRLQFLLKNALDPTGAGGKKKQRTSESSSTDGRAASWATTATNTHTVPYEWERPYTRDEMKDKAEQKEQYNLNPTHTYPTTTMVSMLVRQNRYHEPKVVTLDIVNKENKVPDYLPTPSEATTYREIPQYIHMTRDSDLYEDMDTLWFYNFASQDFITHVVDVVSVSFVCDRASFPDTPEELTRVRPTMHFVYTTDNAPRRIARIWRDRTSYLSLALPPLIKTWHSDSFIELSYVQFMSWGAMALRANMQGTKFYTFDDTLDTHKEYGYATYNVTKSVQELQTKRVWIRHGIQSSSSVYLFGALVPSSHPEYTYIYNLFEQRQKSPLHQFPGLPPEQPPQRPPIPQEQDEKYIEEQEDLPPLPIEDDQEWGLLNLDPGQGQGAADSLYDITDLELEQELNELESRKRPRGGEGKEEEDEDEYEDTNPLASDWVPIPSSSSHNESLSMLDLILQSERRLPWEEDEKEKE